VNSSRRHRARIALVLGLLLVTLSGGRPAGAVIGGRSDGTGHPYAGAIDGRPVGGPVRFASGVLISPTVLLTVAHGTARFDAAGLTRARVTFDPVVTGASKWYEGAVHTNPAYDPSGSGNRGDFGDLGVIVFDEPIPGVTPARLPSPNSLDELDREAGRAAIEIPGYGISRYTGASDGGGQRQPDASSGGVRTVADAAYASLSPGFLRVRMSDDATVCIGDSGSPNLLRGSDLVLGVTAVEWSLAGGQCESSPWAQRVDTPAARSFLGHYVDLD
jgi:V8-like Glu-specific endopeptidase